MTRPLAVFAFLLIAFAFVELIMLYAKLAKMERRVNLAERNLAKLPPPVTVYDGGKMIGFDGKIAMPEDWLNGCAMPKREPLIPEYPTNPRTLPTRPPKRKPAAKRRRKP